MCSRLFGPRCRRVVFRNKPACIRYATPMATRLLEAGVNLRVIQTWLGHHSPSSTALYAHLTHKTGDLATEAVNELMSDLP
jgi:site-specific recombinase XerD